MNKITAEKEILDCRLYSPEYAAIELPYEKETLKRLIIRQENKEKAGKISLLLLVFSPLIFRLYNMLISMLRPNFYKPESLDAFSIFVGPLSYVVFWFMGAIIRVIGSIYCLSLIWDALANSDEPFARKRAIRRGNYTLSLQKDVCRTKISILTKIIEEAEAQKEEPPEEPGFMETEVLQDNTTSKQPEPAALVNDSPEEDYSLLDPEFEAFFISSSK